MLTGRVFWCAAATCALDKDRLCCDCSFGGGAPLAGVIDASAGWQKIENMTNGTQPNVPLCFPPLKIFSTTLVKKRGWGGLVLKVKIYYKLAADVLRAILNANVGGEGGHLWILWRIHLSLMAC